MLAVNKSVLDDFNEAVQLEWLETNGLGGWSSSSVIFCNTRRYHGLLVAATVPPAERMSLLSKLDETIIIGNDRFDLSCNQYEGDTIYPRGNQHVQGFSKGMFPQWTYEVDSIRLKKTIAMLHGENTVLIMYDVIKSAAPFSLEWLPLISARGYHSLQHANNNIWWDVQFENGIFHNKPFEGAPDIYISVPGSSYAHQPEWYYKFNYAVEMYRGLDYEEDLFNHGKISLSLKEGDSVGIIISTESPADRHAHQLLEKETIRRQSLILHSGNKTIQQLVLAADQFIVKRTIQDPATGISQDGATVIAGYHWFTDWGRDTMISLPGLCLRTGRNKDAKKIISAFAKNVSMGMLPNRFRDNNEPPEYNNVDGTLWYFFSVFKYFQATNDKEFILSEILPVLKDIMNWHYKGTRYNIHVDTDELLYAGEKGQQLTWMDAKIGDWVVTPRMGKPVEIQALWYNALKIFSSLLSLNGQPEDSERVNMDAFKAKKSFIEKFWYAEGNYLYDNIDENGHPDTTLRPNQLFAISLHYPLTEGKQAESVLKIIEDKLYTPVGLKSLTPDDIHYSGIYGGSAFKRDSSYHQGTVWTWLLGPYVDALVKTYGSKIRAQEVINQFRYHLKEGCIGSVSEIADGDEPHLPRGCIAQAWGVAEILRVMKEYELQ